MSGEPGTSAISALHSIGFVITNRLAGVDVNDEAWSLVTAQYLILS